MIWRVPQGAWKGETAFILAGGPSLRGFDAAPLRYRRVITINDSWRLAPWATVLYFFDQRWWQWQIDANPRAVGNSEVSFHWLIYNGFWVSAGPDFRDHPQVRYLRLSGPTGLETAPDALRHGSNSGYQAINLAYHFGASRIVLLGYDMQCAGNTTHWHNDHTEPVGTFRVTLEQTMLPKFETLVEPLAAAGVEVINATPNSALTCWPHQPLEEVLRAPAGADAAQHA